MAGIDADVTPTAQYHITGESIAVKSFDAVKGTVTLSSAPRAPENAGTSNIEIKFAKTTETRKKIFGCTIFAIYGLDGSGDRVFLSGNDGFANMEWFSGLSDPTYFPDSNYSAVGSSDFPIMCYLKAQGELLVIKKDNRQEGTIWHHVGTITNNVAAFPLKEGVPGYGAVARYSAANLNDDPLYLSPRGVYAPTTTYYNNMQVRQLFCRSRRVNPKLTKEHGLEEAVAATWRGWYVLVVDGRAYVADGNQDKSDNGYEWYYWINIPARVLRADRQTLYFGTADGRVCKFNDDMVTEENETLMRAYPCGVGKQARQHGQYRDAQDHAQTRKRGASQEIREKQMRAVCPHREGQRQAHPRVLRGPADVRGHQLRTLHVRDLGKQHSPVQKQDQEMDHDTVYFCLGRAQRGLRHL